MAVFRIERTKDYTVMSNHHLRNHELSLKAKGLLSMMLSLPDDWNYTTRGLAKICKEGVDAIGSALRELETAGYIVRNQLRDQQGRISDTEYVIYEKPQPRQPETPRPDTAVPDTASPDTENPYLDKPDTEKPAELNIEKPNTQKQNTHGASTDSIPFRETAAAQLPERKGRDAMSVSEIADIIGVMHEGHLVEEVNISELHKRNRKYIQFDLSDSEIAGKILENHYHMTDFTVQDGTVRIYDFSQSVGEINREFARNGLLVTRINDSEENLEDYFAKLIGGGGIA